MAGKDGEMFMTRSFSVTPKTTEQHLIARNDKFLAYVTNNKKTLLDLHHASLYLVSVHQTTPPLIVVADISNNGVLVYCQCAEDTQNSRVRI